MPRPTAALPGLGVLAGVYGLVKEDKNDFFGFGVGVGVGVDAALTDNSRPNASTKLSQKILRSIFSLLEQFLAKLCPYRQRSRQFAEKKSYQEIFVRTLTDNACTAFIRIRARENFRHAIY